MNKMFTRIIVFIALFMPVMAKAQPATSKPIALYKYAFTSAWGGIPLPVVNINYGGPLSLYKPLSAGFSVTDAFDIAAIKPKAMSPTSVGGGEVEIFGNTNIAYPSTLEAMNPLTKVRFLSKQIAIDKDGVLLLGGFARVTDEKRWDQNSIKLVSTKQRIVQLTNEITETDVFGDSRIIKVTTESLSLDRSIPNSITQKQKTENIPAIDSVKGIAYDPRSSHQDHFFYSSRKGNKRIIGVYFFESNENIILNENAVVGTSENVAGRMVVDQDGDIYIADAEQHVIVKFEMSDDAKEIQDFAIIGGRIGVPGYENDDDGEDARFNRPSGIAVDENENVYISDAGNNCIRKIDGGLFGGDVSTFAGSEDGEGGSYNISLTEDPKVARFRNPLGIAYDYINELLYVADNGNNVIRQLNLDGKVTAIDGNPAIIISTNFVSPTDIAVDPSGFGFYVAAGKIVQYVNTFPGGYVLEQQYRETPDQIFDNLPFVTLPPGLTMKPNGAVFGIPLLKWEPTAYFAYAYNSAGKSLLPAVIILEVIECPLVPDTVIVNDTIAFAKMPYTWDGQVFTEQGSKTISLKTRAGCDSIVVMNLSVLPKIIYSSPNIFSKGIPVTPLIPVNKGTIPDNYSISPALPAGLTMDTGNGTIAGTPTELSYDASITPYGPNTAPVTVAPWELNDYGGDITSVKITDQSGAVLLDNKTQIQNLSGTIGTATGTPGAYSDFSANAVTELFEGKTYTIEVQDLLEGPTPNGYSGPLEDFYLHEYEYYKSSFAILIDFNRDGDFNDPGERVYRSPSGFRPDYFGRTTAHTERTTITLPANFLPGVTKMRIHWMEANTYAGNKSGYVGGLHYNHIIVNTTLELTPYPVKPTEFFYKFTNGEFEDYSVNLIKVNGKSYTIKGSNATGSDITVVKIAVTAPTSSITNQTICQSALPFTWNALKFYSAGTQSAHLRNILGADSTATMNLTIIPTTFSTTNVSYCGTYFWNGQTIVNSGTYTAKFANALGCDSIATLKFRQKRTSSVENISIRPADLPYLWNGQSFTGSGQSSITFTNKEGCDSVANLNLVVNYDIIYPAKLILPINIPIVPISPAIEGNFQIADVQANGYNGFYMLKPTPAGLSVDNWTGVITGTPSELTPLSTYTVKLFQSGAVAANIQISVGVPTTSTLNYSSCGPFLWNGVTYDLPGTYQKHLINQYGMDSTATLNLSIRQATSSVANISVRADQLPIIWKGQTLTAGGDYTKITTNAAGCDSVITLHLNVAPKINYTTPEIFGPGVAITPLIPVNTGGSVPTEIGIVQTFLTRVQPSSMAIDKSGNRYYTTLSGQLFKSSPSGTSSLLSGNIGYCAALTMDHEGNIYAAQTAKNAIAKISTDGSITILASAKSPSGIAVDASGNIYFSEFSNHRIRKVNTNGVVSTLAGSGVAGYANGTGTSAMFNNPAGLAINLAGDIFVADFGNNRIRKITSAGVVSNFAGNGFDGLVDAPVLSASFSSPSAIVNDSYGNLYVVDQSNELKSRYDAKIRKISGEGLVSTLAGSTAGYTDGPGNLAQFYNLQGLAIDAGGYLYAGDPSNGAIRTINTQTYRIRPALPDGLSLDAATGTISGTPVAQLPMPVTFTISAFNLAGVDSTNLTMKICSPTPSSFDMDACDQYTWDGTVYTTAGTYTKLYTNMGGCDSLVTLNLNIRKSSVGPQQTARACDVYSWYGKSYNQTGVYSTNLINAAGCDSVISLNLTIDKSTSSASLLADGSVVFPYSWNGLSINEPGLYSVKLSNSIGCDSTANLFIAGGKAPIISYPVNGDTTFYYNKSNVTLNHTNTGGEVPSLNLNQEGELLLDLNSKTNLFEYTYIDGNGVSKTFHNYPDFMVKDVLGNYYFTSIAFHQIFKMLPDGTITVFAGSITAGFADGTGELASFNSPRGLAFDNAGYLFVADFGNHVIRKIAPDGSVTTIGKYGVYYTGRAITNGTFANAIFGEPMGLAFDKNGDLLVSERSPGDIRRISFSNGTVSTFVNGFNWPKAIAIDVFGNLIVNEYGAYRISKVTPVGDVSVIAGNGGYSISVGPVDGFGSASSINNPEGLYVDPKTNVIYFTDTYGQLSRIETNGFVRKLFWLQAGYVGTLFKRFDARCILGVDETGKISFVNGDALIVQANTLGYGGFFRINDYGVYNNANGVISGDVINPLYTVNFSFNDSAYAANEYGVSIYPMTVRLKKLIDFIERIVVSSFPYTWHGRTFNEPTDTATYLSTNKTLANDTLYHLDLIYDVPLPKISATGDCATNTVTLNASTPAGNAIHFNGSSRATFPFVKDGKGLAYYSLNSYRKPDNSLAFNQSTAFEAWIKPASVSGIQYIVTKDSVETHQGYMAVLINNGKLEYRFKPSTQWPLLIATSSSNIQPGIWTHIAITHLDSTMNVYINGVLSGTTPDLSHVFAAFYYDDVTNKPVSPGFTLGALNSLQYGFNGSMDEVRWWSTPRTTADIVANMNKSVSPSSPGLSLYYKFDESDGDILIDHSVSNWPADLINAPVREIPSSVPMYYNSYLWSPGGATTRSITVQPLVTTPYILTVTDYKGATGSDTLDVSPPTASSTIDVISASGDSYVWNGTTFTSSNNSATWSGFNLAGCDSTVTLNLTLLPAPVPVITASVSTNIREGESVTLDAGNFATYIWLPGGETTSSIIVTPKNTTTYSVTVTDNNGFSGTASITVTVCKTSYSTEIISACGSVNWHGTTYTASNNTAIWSGTNKAGCDSIVTLNLTINSVPEPVISPVNGKVLCGIGPTELTARASGNAISFNGTDRIVEDSMGVDPSGGFTLEGWLNLSKLGSAQSFISQVNGGRSLPFDTFINPDGTVAFEVGNSAALSLVTTVVKLNTGQWHHLAFVYNANVIKIYVDGNEAASGSSVTPESGMMNNFMLGNRSDLSRPLFGTIDEVRVWNTPRTQSGIASSMNSSVAANSASLVAYYILDDLVSDYPVNSVTGVSTATLIGTPVITASSAPVNYVTYLWSVSGATSPIVTANVDGVSSFTVTVTDINGCSNTVSQVVAISQPSFSTDIVSACGSYNWHGVNYTSSTNSAQWITPNASGCDSVVTLNLTIIETSAIVETVTACNYFVWHGKTYSSSTNAATWTGVNAAGCDSVVTLNLTIIHSTKSIDTIVACADSYTWHGTIYTSSNNTATWTGVNAAGCDSVVTLHLTISELPVAEINGNAIIDKCEDDAITLSIANPDFRQYASAVNSFSSQYSSGGYSANQVLGEPNTYPEYGDLSTAWSPSTESDMKEFIELGFAESKRINLIDIYETYNPGSIDSVFVKNPFTDEYELVYTADAVNLYGVASILPIRFPLTNFPVSDVKITMNSPLVYGFKGIDAVAIGQENNISYSWSNGSQESTTKITGPGKYFVTATNANGCVSMDSVEVSIIPTPVISTITNPQSICSGSEIVPILITGGPDGTIYYWNRDKEEDVAGTDVFGQGDIYGTLINLTNIPQPVTFTVIPAYNGCAGEPVTTTVLVNPTPPTPTISITGSTIICEGEHVVLSSSSSIGNQWYFNDVVIDGATNPNFTARIPGIYTVSYIDLNQCASEASLPTTITVNPLPVVEAITGVSDICIGSETIYANVTASGIWSSGNTAVATVDESGLVTGISAGTAEIAYTVTNANNCITVVTKTITVNDYPVVEDITGISDVYVCSTITLSSATTAGIWSSGNTTIATVDENGIVSGLSAGVSIISYSVTTFGCTTTATRTVTVNKLPVTPVLTVTPDTQQYSDRVEFKVVIPNGVNTCGHAASSVTFTVSDVGSQTMGKVNFVADGTNLVATLNKELLDMPNSSVMAPGVKTVSFVLDGVNTFGFIVGLPTTKQLTISEEDARIDFTGTQLVATRSSSSGLATVTLRATVQDISATTDAAGDSNSGDIRNARVQFYNEGVAIGSILTPTLINSSDLKTGIVTLEMPVDIGSADDAQYTIGMKVSGYYVRDNTEDNTVVTVYKPDGDFIAGGGYIKPTNIAGTLGTSGTNIKSHFGFNIKYNKSGKSLKGNMNFLIRSKKDGEVHTYQIKANAMTSLGVNTNDPKSQTAVFVSKANGSEITNSKSSVSLGGNLTVQVNLTDKGEPGTNDQIAISLYDGSTLLYSSNWTGSRTDELVLGGGNLIVQSGFSLTPNKSAEITTDIATEVLENTTLKVYPNPFSDRLNIEFSSTTDTHAKLEIYSITGAKLETLFDGPVEKAVVNFAEYRPRLLSSQMVLYYLTINGKTQVGKVIYKK